MMNCQQKNIKMNEKNQVLLNSKTVIEKGKIRNHFKVLEKMSH